MSIDIPALRYMHENSIIEVDDKASLYSFSSDISQQSGSSYDSVSNDDNFEIWDQTQAIKVFEAISNVLDALDFLHRDGAACDRFTVLVKPPSRSSVVEVRVITGDSLVDLCGKIKMFCDPSEREPQGFTRPLVEACLEILRRLGFEKIAELYFQQSLGSGKTTSPSRCIQICALIAQIASVSLVTYSRGHSREFYSVYLTRTIEYFLLSGLDELGPSIIAERVDLTCMGEMLGRKVWIFHQEIESLGTWRRPFSLSTSVPNLLDTWGGWISVPTDTTITNIWLHTGSGSVFPVAKSAEIDVINDTEIYCHWSPENEVFMTEKSTVPRHAQLLIGATSVNDNCPLTMAACQPRITNNLNPLGTRSPSWKTTGRSTGFSIGKIFNWTATGTQTKDDGRNLKKRLIDDFRDNKDLRKLNSPWGLELSLCTGIARRVLLRELLYGEVLDYLKLGLPGEWQEIETIAPTIADKKDSDFETLLNSLTKKQAKVLRKATELLILAMESTGVKGHTLTLWWPERNESTPRGLKILESQYSGENPWIPMIKDSEHCAVFGLATPRCLQHDDVKNCRQIAPPRQWQTVNGIVLDTTLTPADSAFLEYPYTIGARYLLYKGKDVLRVLKPRTEGIDACVVQLNYIASVTERPQLVARKLLKLNVRMEMVREKQGLADKGQGVIIL